MLKGKPMKVYKEKDLKKGWFIGNFEPTCIKTDLFEVSVKRYNKGDEEPKHHHKLSKELTFIVSGKVSMNNIIYEKGDIIIVSPFESIKFKAIEESVSVVVKMPSVKGDKYED